MDHFADERERTAFRHWLRTGRLLHQGDEPAMHWKYNPWHDPDDGRFTFRNAGRYFGGYGAARRGGFGGGGAMASWSSPAKPEPSRPAAKRPSSPTTAVIAAVVAHRRRRGPRKLHWRNGYLFETDRLHRMRYTDAHLKLGRSSPRSRLAQARAGGSDRLPGDDGGHFIAHRFNGPGDSFNHFAQSARFNRGTYRALEDDWARALRSGDAVRVQITPTYLGTSQRPTAIQVKWTINGNTRIKTFPN